VDPTPLSLRQLWALATAASRELTWGLGAVSREVEDWRRRAAAIPDEAIRSDAISSLQSKRPHLDGAGLFCILPDRRDPNLLRALVTYEMILEFLDDLDERAVEADRGHGQRLHLALVHAVDSQALGFDYSHCDSYGDDGGYLQALVRSCRRCCSALPAYPVVRAALIREATRAQVLPLNHHRDPLLREAALKDWVEREFPGEREESWFELTGAATASLPVHVLLALAADPKTTQDTVERTLEVYFPGVSILATMLDSYVDRIDDAAETNQSYISYYRDDQVALARLCELIHTSISRARDLPNGERHAVIAACMVAMYLSRDSAREAHSRAASAQLLRAGGSLSRSLWPVLRIWRTVYSLRTA
jgi:tetraprenyl-beta-curcumene synthase